MGIGIGLVFVPTATIVTRYFNRMRGLAIGIAMSGGPFGGMILTASTFLFRSSAKSLSLILSSSKYYGWSQALISCRIVLIYCFSSTSILSRTFGSSIRFTAYLITPLLVIGFLLMMNPPVEPKPALPVPRLDIARYSKDMEYLAAAGGSVDSLLMTAFNKLISLQNLSWLSVRLLSWYVSLFSFADSTDLSLTIQHFTSN